MEQSIDFSITPIYYVIGEERSGTLSLLKRLYRDKVNPELIMKNTIQLLKNTFMFIGKFSDIDNVLVEIATNGEESLAIRLTAKPVEGFDALEELYKLQDEVTGDSAGDGWLGGDTNVYNDKGLHIIYAGNK